MTSSVLDRIAVFFQPQSPFWACELTSRHVVVTGVDRKRSHVEGQAVVDLPRGALAGSLTASNVRNSDAVQAAVREALYQSGFRGYEIGVVIPDDAARIALITADTFPANAEEQLAFIRWKLKKTVPFDTDAAQIAFRTMGARDLLVTLSPRSIIQEYENVMRDLELHAGFVIPSTLAALNLFHVPAEDALFLKTSPDCATTSIFQGEKLRFYRRVSDQSLYGAVLPTILYYQDKLGGKAMRQMTLCSHEADAAAIADLQEKLGIPVRLLQPKNTEDIYKPALGAVGLHSQSRGRMPKAEDNVRFAGSRLRILDS